MRAHSSLSTESLKLIANELPLNSTGARQRAFRRCTSARLHLGFGCIYITINSAITAQAVSGTDTKNTNCATAGFLAWISLWEPESPSQTSVAH